MMSEPSADKSFSFPEGPNLEAIPEELKVLKRWVVWKYVERPGAEKPTKPPYNAATDELAESNNSVTWSTFEVALKALETGKYEGLGFMFGYEESNGITYSGVDLDNLTSPEKWEEANQIIKFFDSYAEISPSKQGVHILFKGSKGEGRPRERTKGVEIYDKTHYFTVTGWKVKGAPATVNEREEQLREFYDKIFSSPEAKRETDPAEEKRVIEDRRPEPVALPPVVSHPVAPANPTLSDEEVVAIASRAANGEKFRRLYNDGDISAYDDDDSSGDMALMCVLAFYTKDPAQLERIFGNSALAGREKWQKRPDYRKRTIEAALGLVKEQYNPRHALYEFSPNGNADRLVDRFGADLLCRIRMSKKGTASGEWLIWNGNIWRPDDTLQIERLGREIINGIFEESKRILDEDIRKKVRKFATNNDNIRNIRMMLDAAKSDERIARRAKDFDINPQLMGLPGEGGLILELNDSGYEVRAARKDDMITMAAGVIPARRDDLRQPKKWLAFLNLIFKGDNELIRYMQKLMGYSILGTQAEQLFVLFYGTGANGKSTLVGTWQLIFGDYGTYPDIKTFSRKFDDKEIRSDLRAILKHRLVTPVEGRESIKLDETLSNRWTGGQEPITTRDLYEPTASEWPQGLLAIVANNRPVISETNYGIWRRVRLIPFNVNLEKLLKPEELIREYEKTLFAEEGDLIFRWMLEGYELYRLKGLKSPPAVEEATRKYESESNSLLQFCNNMLMLDPEAEIQASELTGAYAKYCMSEHIEAIDLKKVKEEIITKIYAHAGVKHRRRRNAIYYVGLRLKTDLDFEVEERINDFVEESFKYRYNSMEWSPLIDKDGKAHTLKLFGVGLV